MNPFEIIKNVSMGRKGPNLLKDCSAYKEANNLESADKNYPAFMVNRGLSYFEDTVFFAAEIDKNYHLEPKMQYDFFRNALNPRKRFSKWNKKQKPSDIVNLLKEVYGYSTRKAEQVIDILNEEDIKELKTFVNKGGVRKK